MELDLRVAEGETIYAYSIDTAYRNRKFKRRIQKEEDWYLSELEQIQAEFLKLLFDPNLHCSYDVLYQNLLEWQGKLHKKGKEKRLKYITPNPKYIHHIYKSQV